METRERIIPACNYLKNVGIISSRQNVADKMGVRKESVSEAFSGNNAYICLLDIGISNGLAVEFDECVFKRLYESFYDISNGGMMMAGLEILRVPKY